jgi:siroheme decarboxylase
MSAPALDPVDRRLLQASQSGLPLSARPYHALAEQLGLAPENGMARLRRLLASGVIRRIGAVPNHYALGVRANGMSVWDVDNQRLGTLGPKVGALTFVSHCYLRPRRMPLWPYNLFAMIHGRALRSRTRSRRSRACSATRRVAMTSSSAPGSSRRRGSGCHDPESPMFRLSQYMQELI